MLILKKFIGLEGAAGMGVIRLGDIRTGSYNTLLVAVASVLLGCGVPVALVLGLIAKPA